MFSESADLYDLIYRQFKDGFHVCRMAHTQIHGNIARIRFEYLAGDSEGIRKAEEVHELEKHPDP